MGAAASFAETVLFAFDFASVAGEEALFAKNGFAFRIEFFQGAGNAEFASVGLTGNAAAADGDDDVDRFFFLGREERREDGVAGSESANALLTRLASTLIKRLKQ